MLKFCFIIVWFVNYFLLKRIFEVIFNKNSGFQDPISFHKFVKNDPRGIYNDWFRKSDQFLLQSENQHQEL